MELEQFKTKIEAIYEKLRGLTFQGFINERNTTAVYTGGPRYVVNVNSQNVRDIMTIITMEIMELSKTYEPYDGQEKVWKGITGSQLWVKSYPGDDKTTTFTVTSIEVVTGLNWQIPNYKAIVNITLV